MERGKDKLMTRIITLLLLLFFSVPNVMAQIRYGAQKQEVSSIPVDPSLDDDFSSEKDQWSFVDNDGNTGGSYSVSGGQLTLSSNGGDTWTDSDEYVCYYLDDVSGDFDYSIKVVSVTSNNATWGKGGIVVKSDMTVSMDSSALIYYGIIDRSANDVVYVQQDTDLDGDWDTSGASSSISGVVFLRAKRSGNVFTLYSSSDGNSWTSEDTDTIVAGGTVDVGLFFCNNSDGNNGNAVFDDFNDLSDD